MKFVKYLAFAMMALCFSACLGDDDEKDTYTVSFSDFLAVGDNGTSVKTDEDSLLQVSNPSALRLPDNTYPDRVIASFNVEYNKSGKPRSKYIEVLAAQRCYTVPCANKEEIDVTTEFKLSRPNALSMTKKYLNVYVEGYFGSSTSEKDFHLYVDRVEGANVFLNHTCKQGGQDYGSKALSYLIHEELEKYRSQIVPAGGKIALIINNDQTAQINYEWK